MKQTTNCLTGKILLACWLMAATGQTCSLNNAYLPFLSFWNRKMGNAADSRSGKTGQTFPSQTNAPTMQLFSHIRFSADTPAHKMNRTVTRCPSHPHPHSHPHPPSQLPVEMHSLVPSVGNASETPTQMTANKKKDEEKKRKEEANKRSRQL